MPPYRRADHAVDERFDELKACLKPEAGLDMRQTVGGQIG
jgi:hypothetical protein